MTTPTLFKESVFRCKSCGHIYQLAPTRCDCMPDTEAYEEGCAYFPALAAQPELPEPVTTQVEQFAVNRYRTVPDGLQYKVTAGDGTRAIWHGTKDECRLFVAKATEAFLDGAFAAQQAQVKQAVEQKEKAADEWRGLALQFDGHRMQALGWLKAVLKELPEDAWPFARTFVSAPPLSGEQVLADRIAAQAKREPMTEHEIQELGFDTPHKPMPKRLLRLVRAVEAHHGIGDKA